MSREATYSAIVLKKQPYKEADEIITLYTKEQGKVRAIAKSIKSPKSKLQQKLQALFLVEVRLTLGKMNKIIGAEPVKVYHHLRENLAAMKMAFYASELVMKITADEQKNEALFNLLQQFLDFLDKEKSEKLLNLALAKFKIEILEVSGLGMPDEKNELFLKLKALDLHQVSEVADSPGLLGLQESLSRFIEYQLERKVQSEKYLEA